MDETVFWTMVGAIGQVLGAAATFAAVVVSLWIVLSERRVHIKASAGLRLLVAGDGSPFEDQIGVRITNHGLRPVRVSSIGWRTGWLRFGPKWWSYQYAIQTFPVPVSLMSSPIPPFDIDPGQEIGLLLSPDWYKPGEQRDTFFNRKLPLRRKPSPTKVCLMVNLVAAKTSVTRVERSLEKFLATGVIADGAEKANKASASRTTAG